MYIKYCILNGKDKDDSTVKIKSFKKNKKKTLKKINKKKSNSEVANSFKILRKMRTYQT